MRLCYFANSRSLNTTKWVNFFAKRYELFLIDFYDLPTKEKYDDNVKIINLKQYYPFGQPLKGKISYLSKLFELKKYLKKIKPDILHAHYIIDFGWLAALSGFHPLVVSAWGSDLYLENKGSRIKTYLSKYTLSKADVMTSNSFDQQRIINEYNGHSENNIIVQCDADLSLFHPDYDIKELKEKLQIPKDYRVIFSPRACAPLYNINIILKAFILLLKEIKNVILILVDYNTKEEYKKELEDYINQANIKDNIRFIKRISYEEMPLFYNLADLTVSVPISDGTAGSLTESMACGTPIIVSDLPTTTEWVKDNQNGLVVPVGDVEALKDTMFPLLTIEDLRVKFRNNGLALAKEKFDYTKHFNFMDEWYKKLLKK